MVPEEKLDCFGLSDVFNDQNKLAFYSGPVQPPVSYSSHKML